MFELNLNHALRRCVLLGGIASAVAFASRSAQAFEVGTDEAQSESQAKGQAQYTGSENCQVFPSTALPILKWCENNQSFRYQILTWNETTTYSKRRIKESIQKVVTKFLDSECKTERLSLKQVQTARFELWLAVPWSGAELAQPRVGLQFDNRHFVFANAWNKNWEAQISNLHILGQRSYDTFGGDSLSGLNPEKIMIRPEFETADLKLEPELTELLRLNGVTELQRLRGSLPLYSGKVARYQEQKTVDLLKANSEVMEHLEWVEPSYKVEAIGDRFNLFSEVLTEKAIPKSCK
jgi:hypothetical protein